MRLMYQIFSFVGLTLSGITTVDAELLFRGIGLGQTQSEIDQQLPRNCDLRAGSSDSFYDLLLGASVSSEIVCELDTVTGGIHLNISGFSERIILFASFFNADNYTFPQFLTSLEDAYDLQFVPRDSPNLAGGTVRTYEAVSGVGTTVSAVDMEALGGMLGHYIVVWPTEDGAQFD